MKNNASEIKDLTGQAAIDKFKEIVKHEQTCLFSTNLGNVPQTTRPMAYFISFNAGGHANKSTAIQGSLVVFYIFTPLASFLLAVIFALFPYKGKTYRKKYLPVSLFIYLILNIALLLLLLVALSSMNATR